MCSLGYVNRSPPAQAAVERCKGGLCVTIWRQTRKKPLESCCGNVVESIRGINCEAVAMNSEDVVDPTHPETLAGQEKLCLRILAHLNFLVHGLDNPSFLIQLVCDNRGRANRYT